MNYFERNLYFINQGYHKFDLPKEHVWIKRYFKTKLQSVFLKYFYTTRTAKHFVEHTGYYTTIPNLSKLSNKFYFLMEMFTEAKKNMDLDLLTKITTKKVRMPKRFY
jgi:hypothetical protein